EIATVPPPTWGGVNLLEALNLVEEADLRSLGHYTESAAALERLVSISRVGELFGTAMLGMLIDQPEPDLVRRYAGGPFDLRARVTDAHARSLWKRMQRPEWREFDRQLFTKPLGAGHSDAVVAV